MSPYSRVKAGMRVEVNPYHVRQGSKTRCHQLSPTRAPKLGDWVWVTDYIDFTPKQRELTRVCWDPHSGGQFTLEGYWRHGEWAYTSVILVLNNLKHMPRKTPWVFKRLAKREGNSVWEARLGRVKS